MDKLRGALRRSSSPAVQQTSYVFNVEVQSESDVTHRMEYSSPLPFTAAEVISLLQAEPDRLEGVLVAADNPGPRLGPRTELDPAKKETCKELLFLNYFVTAALTKLMLAVLHMCM